MPLYRREDTGEVVEMPFSAIWQQDELGYITLPDGVKARRQIRLEIERESPQKTQQVALRDRPIVSDSLGFPRQQLAEFEADRIAHGFTGIEFKPDPQVPEFMQVHIGSEKEKARYMRHRGFFDRNSRNGGSRPLTEEQMRAAEQRAKEMYPDAKNPALDNSPASRQT